MYESFRNKTAIIISEILISFSLNIYVYIKKGDISTLNGSSLKLVDKFIYLGSSVSSAEKWHQYATSESMDHYQ